MIGAPAVSAVPTADVEVHAVHSHLSALEDLSGGCPEGWPLLALSTLYLTLPSLG